jgi:hypothetical protein
MFIPGKLKPDGVTVFKIVKIAPGEKEKNEDVDEFGTRSLVQDDKDKNATSLKIEGLGPANDILFTHSNPN